MRGARSSTGGGPWPRFVAWLLGPLMRPLAERREARRFEQLEADARSRPHDERVLLALADARRAAGHDRDAIERYWQAAQLFIGGCHYAKALAVIQVALELEPEALFLRRGAAQTLERLGRNHDAATAYRQAATLAERRGRAPDAEHMRGRADMLDPPKGRRPTIIRDLVPGGELELPPSPLAEALATPAGTGARPKPQPASATPPPLPRRRRTAPPPPPPREPSWRAEMLDEPPLPMPRADLAKQSNDAPRTRMQIPRAGPAHDSGPDVPILRVDARRVDEVVAKEMARAFGTEGLEPRDPTGPRLDPVVEDLARDAARMMHSTELALDAELHLLAHDPAEQATAQCSPQEIHEIKTRTLIASAEQELQVLLTVDDVTVEQEIHEPGGSYA